MFYLVSDQQCFELFVYKFTPVITSDTFYAAKYTYISLGGYESRWKIEFGFEYFTGNHERRHLEEGISISFACTVYMY